ncbi:hypothetical protein N7476_004717 [Penicillium atrosanguineum]|uniref:Uncharacterized protein n=1 Tax=Penicillium atrosanguineum TaxID=1132637 RepID=A0A9W9U6Y0_9EURO|nr:hypothetical protein N7476_004717 [Penicillium atrosanguineum]
MPFGRIAKIGFNGCALGLPVGQHLRKEDLAGEGISSSRILVFSRCGMSQCSTDLAEPTRTYVRKKRDPTYGRHWTFQRSIFQRCFESQGRVELRELIMFLVPLVRTLRGYIA